MLYEGLELNHLILSLSKEQNQHDIVVSFSINKKEKQMKKIIMTMVVAVASMISFGAIAQDQKCEKSECAKQCDKAVKCDKKKSHGMVCPNLFEGIDLTQEQKDKLKAMRPCPKAQKQAIKEKCRRHRQVCDSMAQVAREKHLADMKSVLTPEQYVQYLENIAKQAPQGKMHMNKRGKGMKRGCHKQHKDCQQGECPKK